MAQEVNHPSHYKGNNGIEAIDAIEAALGFDGVLHFCHGNAIKYLFRAGNKEGNPAHGGSSANVGVLPEE